MRMLQEHIRMHTIKSLWKICYIKKLYFLFIFYYLYMTNYIYNFLIKYIVQSYNKKTNV